MPSLKRLSILFLVFALSSTTVFAATLPSASFEDPALTNFSNYNNPFSDTHLLMLEGQAAAELFRRKITSGYTDKTFRGHREVNRAEVAKFLIQARYGAVEAVAGSNKFTDIKTSHWFYKHVRMAHAKGIISGYLDNTFRAGDTINTVEFLKMFARTFDVPDNLPHSYKDIEPGVWYTGLAGIASTYKMFPERIENLDPNRKLTRTEVAIALYNYFLNREDSLPEPVELSSKTKVKATVYSHHKLGNPEAKVAIDFHGSLEEPNTRILFKTLKQLQSDYSEDVRVIWHYFPLSSYNTLEYRTANSIECAADQNKFWEYLEIVLEQDPSAFGSALYLNAAQTVDLNIKQFELCLEQEPYLGRIQHDKEQATKSGLDQVPTMYISGEPHVGAKSYNYIENIVKEELEKE